MSTRILSPVPAGTQGSRALRLTLHPDTEDAQVLVCSLPRVTLGRARNVDVPIDRPEVSAYHAALSGLNDGVLVHDLQSTNGTFFSGCRLERGVVPSGATLDLAGVPVRVELDAPLPQDPGGGAALDELLVGRSPPMRRLFDQLRRLVGKDLSVLIQGETGTGKELVARTLHRHHPRRKDGPLQTLNCAALPEENMLLSHLFGHEPGAYTGTAKARPGAFEEAHGGVIFLDEIHCLSPKAQQHLLRPLETKEVQRLGSDRSRKVDFLALFATNTNLCELVNENKFAQDLFYRIAQASVQVPPLRDRREDIPLLIDHFLAGTDKRMDRAVKTFFMDRDWPGNVRELRNMVLGLASWSETRFLTQQDLSDYLAMQPHLVAAGPLGGTLEDAVEEYVLRVYDACGRNMTQAAKRAGIARNTFREKLQQALKRRRIAPAFVDGEGDPA